MWQNMIDETLQKQLGAALSEQLKVKIQLNDAKSVHGGDINETFRIATNEGYFFVKMNDAGRFPDMFAQEYAGLLELRSANALPVPKPLAYGAAGGRSYLLLEFLDKGRRGMASTFLVRMKVGPVLVDAKGVSRLYANRVRKRDLLLLVAAAVVTMVLIFLVSEPARVLVRELPDGAGRELFLPRAELAEYGRTHEHPAGVWAYEALRIAAHRPRIGLEVDQRTIPHELGWLDTAVHLNKGCYRGQETVARVENLGHPPRRLVMLHLDGTEERLPAHGAAVLHDGREVGAVTSAARHYELGPIALAVVKRNVPVEAVLEADGLPAAQEVVVPPDAGGSARERLRRHG